MNTAAGTGLCALLMLIAANSAPWLIAQLLGPRWMAPLDFGLMLGDGQRLLGSHKTWRGLIAGVIATACVGRLFGLEWWLGAAFGALSGLNAITTTIVVVVFATLDILSTRARHESFRRF